MLRIINSFTYTFKFNKATFFSVFFIAALICITPPKTLAYDNDTHFWLTYYLARKAGYTNIQATQIASANVSVDFDKDTEPVLPRPSSFLDWRQPLSHFQFVRQRYHALPSRSLITGNDNDLWNPNELNETFRPKAVELVNQRKAEFWSETAGKERLHKNPGFFFHYLQDVHAHKNFTSFIGHAGYYWVDFLATDRRKAAEMTVETLKYLHAYMEIRTGKKQFMSIEEIDALEIEKYYSAETIAEIKLVVEKLCDVNPSYRIKPNGLYDAWSNLSEKERNKDKKIPSSYLKVINGIRKFGVVPNSSEARKVIQDALGIKDENDLPHIWLYDYNKSGTVEEYAKYARRYEPWVSYTIKPYFTSKDELGNSKKTKIFELNKRKCLPFALAEDSIESVPDCP